MMQTNLAIFVALALHCTALTAPANAEEPKTNVVLILIDDLGEKNNLSAKDPAKVSDLHAKMKAWRDEVGADMMRPNPGYEGAKQ